MSDQQRAGAAGGRRDVLVETDPRVARGVEAAIRAMRGGPPRPDRDGERLAIRASLIEPAESDPNGFERIIGTSDLLSVNFLARGLRAAAAVCRIKVPSGDGEWYGTGFLVGPRLLMTNNHVLSRADEAAQARAEFGYEHDADGVLPDPIQFNLDPREIFFTDADHDVTLIAVVPYSDHGVPLERFGYLPLLPLSGKGLAGEWVTIIQHPGAEPKQMTVRASQIVELDRALFPNMPPHLIHYTTDTDPGSSGSPVLNDQWQVVAIHHKAIPRPPSERRAARIAPARPQWIANEGVRVSAICQLLERRRFSDQAASRALARLSQAVGMRPLQAWSPSPPAQAGQERSGRPLEPAEWARPGLGHDPDFLPVRVDLAAILAGRAAAAAPLLDGSGVVLDYLHFSVVVDRLRRFPMLTAVNIHGARLRHPGARSDIWRRDARMVDDVQAADNFYVASLGDDPVSFSRGHLVRRFDPCWGTEAEARVAESHTFHFTNAAPQVQGFNDIEWGNLEDYVLDRIQTRERRATVLTGPIFKDFDPTYGQRRAGGPWQIPVSYWKIAVIERPGGEVSAAAFMIGQAEYIQSLYEARVFTGLKPYTYDELQTRRIQTTVAAVERETGFDFSALRPFDAQGELESTRRTRFLSHQDDILI